MENISLAEHKWVRDSLKRVDKYHWTISFLDEYIPNTYPDKQTPDLFFSEDEDQ